MKVFSRSVEYRPGGKADQVLKTTVDEAAKDAVIRRARDLGVTEAEYVRDLVMVNIFGADHMLSLYKKHLEVIGQNGAKNGRVEV